MFGQEDNVPIPTPIYIFVFYCIIYFYSGFTIDIDHFTIHICTQYLELLFGSQHKARTTKFQTIDQMYYVIIFPK